MCFNQEEGWVVCRVFKKRMTTVRKMGEYDSPCWYEDQVPYMPEVDYPRQASQPYASSYRHQYPPCKQELELQYSNLPHHEALFLQLPQLDSPNSAAPHVYERCNNAGSNLQPSALTEDQEHMLQMHHQSMSASLHGNASELARDQVTDWRVLDKFVASQLSHDNAINPKDATSQDFTAVSNSTCQIELWK